MGLWDWLAGAGVDVTGIISGGGLLTLTTMTLTDRLVTKGRLLRDLAVLTKAHDEETSNLKRFQDALLAEKDRRYADLQERETYYRLASDAQRERADKVTDQLAESLELSRAAVHALTSLDEAARTE